MNQHACCDEIEDLRDQLTHANALVRVALAALGDCANLALRPGRVSKRALAKAAHLTRRLRR